MYPTKSLGYDGMPALFYQKHWDVVGDEVTRYCLGVLNGEGSVKEVNHTLLALIPKVKKPTIVTEFRPISLCTVLYKHWVSKIMDCLRTFTFYVLWKGQSLGQIAPQRGLRQGCPLSPYLFLLCAEGFSGLFRRAEEEGSIQGVTVAIGAPSISHLFFLQMIVFCF